MKRQTHFLFKVLLSTAILLPARSYAADGNNETSSVNFGDDRLDARAAGITGGIIVGAEAVIAVEAAVGVNKLWPYLVFPAVGAAGGGVGGYFLQKASTPGAVALLVTGIAMIVPTAVLTASAFFYDPKKDGAVEANAMERGAYSFEMPPEKPGTVEETQKETQTVIDVEQPSEIGPPADAAPPTYEDAPPPEAGDEETSSKENETAHAPSARKKSAARARPAPGTLLYISSTGDFSMSVPLIDVRPVSRTERDLRADGALRRKEGVEFYIALLRVDLP